MIGAFGWKGWFPDPTGKVPPERSRIEPTLDILQRGIPGSNVLRPDPAKRLMAATAFEATTWALWAETVPPDGEARLRSRPNGSLCVELDNRAGSGCQGRS